VSEIAEFIFERRRRERGTYEDAVTRLYAKLRMIRDVVVNGHGEQQRPTLPIGQEKPGVGYQS
jgi:hypothetical protein